MRNKSIVIVASVLMGAVLINSLIMKGAQAQTPPAGCVALPTAPAPTVTLQCETIGGSGVLNCPAGESMTTGGCNPGNGWTFGPNVLLSNGVNCSSGYAFGAQPAMVRCCKVH